MAASYLTATNGKAVSQLLEWASWGLCYLECGTMLLLRAWNSGDAAAASACLLDALDAGAVGLASRRIAQRVHLKHHDRVYSQMRMRIKKSR